MTRTERKPLSATRKLEGGKLNAPRESLDTGIKKLGSIIRGLRLINKDGIAPEERWRCTVECAPRVLTSRVTAAGFHGRGPHKSPCIVFGRVRAWPTKLLNCQSGASEQERKGEREKEKIIFLRASREGS